jgi:hypothetical protein
MSLTKADIADRLFNEVGLNKREAKEFVRVFRNYPGSPGKWRKRKTIRFW